MVGRYLPPLLSVVGVGVEATPVKMPRTRSNGRLFLQRRFISPGNNSGADLWQATDVSAIPQQTLHSILHTRRDNIKNSWPCAIDLAHRTKISLAFMWVNCASMYM